VARTEIELKFRGAEEPAAIVAFAVVQPRNRNRYRHKLGYRYRHKYWYCLPPLFLPTPVNHTRPLGVPDRHHLRSNLGR
jgi:hypothetical protein